MNRFLGAGVASVVARVADRVRPWRAPEPAPTAPTALVIGAGSAGLASAALLRRAGVSVVVVDASGTPGGGWPGRYDSLRLNTVRWMSDLPGYRMPRRLGRWVGRDALTGYLVDYAEHHGLPVRRGTVDRIDRVDRVDSSGRRWAVVVDGTTERFDAVVVASGHSSEPMLPDWPGRDVFAGRLIHAGEYRRPGDHPGRVVVVGAGSSGGEICVDLVKAGRSVTWSIRSAPQVFPREMMGMPTTPFAPVGDAVPDRWLDRIAPWVERLAYGRRDYLPAAEAGLTELLSHCKEPMTADGIVDAIRRGDVRVVPPVTGLTANGVVLADGSQVPADDVIAGTGYRPGLEGLVGHLGVLTDGRPSGLVPLPGLGFVGFRVPLTGTLWAIESDARRVARWLAGDLVAGVGSGFAAGGEAVEGAAEA